MKKNEIESGFYQGYAPKATFSNYYYVANDGQVYLLKNKKLNLLKEESAKSLWVQQQNGIFYLIKLRLDQIPIHYLRLVMGLPLKNPSKKVTKRKSSTRKTSKKKSAKKKVRKNCWA